MGGASANLSSPYFSDECLSENARCEKSGITFELSFSRSYLNLSKYNCIHRSHSYENEIIHCTCSIAILKNAKSMIISQIIIWNLRVLLILSLSHG